MSPTPPISKPTFAAAKWQVNSFSPWANGDSLRCFMPSPGILNDAVLEVLIQSISSTLLVGTASFLTGNSLQYRSIHLSLWLPV